MKEHIGALFYIVLWTAASMFLGFVVGVICGAMIKGESCQGSLVRTQEQILSELVRGEVLTTSIPLTEAMRWQRMEFEGLVERHLRVGYEFYRITEQGRRALAESAELPS